MSATSLQLPVMHQTPSFNLGRFNGVHQLWDLHPYVCLICVATTQISCLVCVMGKIPVGYKHYHLLAYPASFSFLFFNLSPM